MGFIHTKLEFYGMRFSLGIAEAAFFPGMITHLSHWYRQNDRAKVVALFMAAIPVARVIAAPISANWLGLAVAADPRGRASAAAWARASRLPHGPPAPGPAAATGATGLACE
jgi:MFS family permease